MAQLFKLRGDANKPTENYEAEPKDFCGNSIFITYLDNIILQLQSRFHQINLSARHPSLNTKEPGFINKRILNR